MSRLGSKICSRRTCRWIDCKDPKVCALETQITKDLVPYVDKTYKTVDNAKARGCIGYSMGASGCLNLAVKHPTIFGSVLVQSPGVWCVIFTMTRRSFFLHGRLFLLTDFLTHRPRFVSWDELISSEGAKTSDFSTRDFLLEKVFDGKGDYESKNTCNMLDSKLRSGDELQNHRCCVMCVPRSANGQYPHTWSRCVIGQNCGCGSDNAIHIFHRMKHCLGVSRATKCAYGYRFYFPLHRRRTKSLCLAFGGVCLGAKSSILWKSACTLISSDA